MIKHPQHISGDCHVASDYVVQHPHLVVTWCYCFSFIRHTCLLSPISIPYFCRGAPSSRRQFIVDYFLVYIGPTSILEHQSVTLPACRRTPACLTTRLSLYPACLTDSLLPNPLLPDGRLSSSPWPAPHLLACPPFQRPDPAGDHLQSL